MFRSIAPILVTLLLFPCLAFGQEKHALLIGVSEYKHSQMNSTKPQYPEADARAVGDALKKSNYQVVALLGRAATAKKVSEALDEIAKKW